MPGHARRCLSLGHGLRLSTRPKEKPTVAYLNLSGDSARAAVLTADESLLQSPGGAFSLRGQIIQLDDSDLPMASSMAASMATRKGQLYFSLGMRYDRQYWRWCPSRQHHVPHRSSARLSRTFFTLPLYNADGSENVETLSVLSAAPSFACLNSQCVPESVRNLVANGDEARRARDEGSNSRPSRPAAKTRVV